MAGASALAVPQATDRLGGLTDVTLPTLMDSTPTLRNTVLITLYGNTGNPRHL